MYDTHKNKCIAVLVQLLLRYLDAVSSNRYDWKKLDLRKRFEILDITSPDKDTSVDTKIFSLK